MSFANFVPVTITPSAGAPSAMAQTVGTTPVLILASTTVRKQFFVVNNSSSAELYLGFGFQPSSTLFTVHLQPNGQYRGDVGGWGGDVWAVASTTTSAITTELY